MTAWVFPPVIPAVPVMDGRRFAVRRIFCVARNYADHAREMGANPEREPPFFFLKPADAVFPVTVDGQGWPFPCFSRLVHHEVELVVALGSSGGSISTPRRRQRQFGGIASGWT